MPLKTIAVVFAIVIFSSFLNCFNSSAQENVLKVDFSNSIFGNYSLSYERAVNKKQAININLCVMPNRDLFKFGADLFSTYSEVKIENNISGFSVSPEYRFYFGKNEGKSMRGFYLAPYFRLSDYKMLLHDTYHEKKTKVDIDLFTTGVGVQLGAHWILSDVFSIDWQFFGIGVDRHKILLDYSAEEEGVDFKGYGPRVAENNAEIFFVGKDVETEYGDDYVKSRVTTFMPGARARLTLGIAF